jgi:hypothetical protein
MENVILGDFKKQIQVDSPTYGKYIVTKVCTLDFIKAAEANQLGEVAKVYSELKKSFMTQRVVKLSNKKFGPEGSTQTLSKFEIYVPIFEDNLNWKVPIRGHENFKSGKLPIAYKLNYVQKVLSKLK